MSKSESIREPGRNPRLRPSHWQPLATTGMSMARGISRAVVGTAQWLGDHITDWTGLAALRVPLARASGRRAVTLDLPGYRRIPYQVYLANNGLPFFTRNRVSLSAFRRLR